MKINISASDLREGLNKVLTVVDRKNSRPILTNCLIKAEQGKLNLIATDLEVSAKVILNGDISEEGSFCLNIKNVFDIVRELPEADVQLSVVKEKNLINISCNNINYSLLITPAEEYPQTNFENNENYFGIQAQDILKIISNVSHAVSTDETRINLNGIFLQRLDSKLRSVAIDGHRLALLDIHNFEGDSQSLVDGIIVPRKGITELKKIAENYQEDKIKISVDDSFIFVNANEQYFLSIRLIAREYPKYQTVIPPKTAFDLTVDRNSLLNAVRRVRILSNEKTNGVKFSFEKDTITISANHPSLGNAREVISCSYDGEEMGIGFNAKYLMDVLTTLQSSEINFEFNNELSPVIIKSPEHPDFLGIIMPLKL